MLSEYLKFIENLEYKYSESIDKRRCTIENMFLAYTDMKY